MKKLSRVFVTVLAALLFSTGLGWAQGNVFGTAALPSAPVIPGPLTLSNLTASQAVGTNASKQLVTADNTTAATFNTLTLPPLTLGSVIFTGSGGLLSQDNANFFWDPIDHWLGLGTATPAYMLDLHGSLNVTGASNLGGAIILAAGATRAIYVASFSNQLQIDAASLALNSASGGKVGIGTASPTKRLSVWGGSADVANTAALGSEVLDTNCANWTVAGDFACGAGPVFTYTDSTHAGTITLPTVKQLTPAIGAAWEHFVYTIASASGTAPVCSITTAYMSASTSVAVAIGAAQVIDQTSATNPANFVISCTSVAGGTFALSAASLKQVIGGSVQAAGQLISTIPTGTAPLVVASTTPVSNLAITAAGAPAPTLTLSTSRSAATNAEIEVCTTTCSFTPLTPVSPYGQQFCVQNNDNISTVITIAAVANIQYEATARTSFGTANRSMTSAGTVGDQICMVAIDATHYNVFSYQGIWTNTP